MRVRRSILILLSFSLLATGLLGCGKKRAQDHAKKALEHFQRGETDKALLEYAAAQKADPENIDALYGEGWIRLERGETERALTVLGRCLQISDKIARCHKGFGALYATIGNGDEAERSFRKALELDPSDAGTYANLGSLLIGAGRLEEAEPLLQEASKRTPDVADSRNGLLAIDLARKQWKGVLDEAALTLQLPYKQSRLKAQTYELVARAHLGLAAEAKDPKLRAEHLKAAEEAAAEGQKIVPTQMAWRTYASERESLLAPASKTKAK